MRAKHSRLPLPYGTLVDRTRTLRFRFAGEAYEGHPGDTVASALAANGVRLLSRSFKYHRPRGVQSLAGNDGHTLVQIGEEPNVRADSRPLCDGLVIEAQNVLGSLACDAGRVLELVSRFLPVGFYYHAFHRPQGAWRWWEPIIRRMAGLGRVVQSAPHVEVEHLHLHTDVAVIGGGAAGMSAALAAARAGADVLLLDDGPCLGGALAYASCTPQLENTRAELAALRAAVAAEPGITVRTATTVTGWFADRWLTAIAPDAYLKIRARAVVAATGAIEQPLVFRHNDTPGVLLSGAAERLMEQYGVKPGQRALVVTATSAGYGCALSLHRAGVEVVAVLELARSRAGDPLHDAVRAAGIDVRYDTTVYAARRRRLGHALVGATIGPTNGRGPTTDIACDLICMSAALVPAAGLLCQAGGDLRVAADGTTLVVTPPGDTMSYAAGAVNGRHVLADAAADGHDAGLGAAHALGFADTAPPSRTAPTGAPQGHSWPIVDDGRGRAFVDFDEDLQIADIEDSVASGYADFDLLKRYSTVVMGPSQGRYSALNALRIAAAARGVDLAGQRLTTQRPPLLPEPIAHLAGRARAPLRRTPMHDWHVAHGAHMIPAGTWLRPARYGPDASAVAREVAIAHERVGLIDVSTLGKLEIAGADAGEFVDRIYAGRHRNQAAGRLRYALLLDESGVVVDDGVAARLDDGRYYVSATTTGVEAVYRQMLRWAAQWQLAVDIQNVTSAWCAVNVVGPAAQALLEAVIDDIDLAATTLPAQSCREGHLRGMPVRLLRVGFVGGFSCEVHAPAHCGAWLWETLLEAGTAHGVGAVGIEAQRVLRLEQGHLIVGQDTDGLTTPMEAGIARAAAMDKPFFVGQRALEAHARKTATRTLVGFTLPADAPQPEECCLTLRGNDIVGRVTSIARSQHLGCTIGLAYVAPDMAGTGARFDIKLADGRGRVSATIVERPFARPGAA